MILTSVGSLFVAGFVVSAVGLVGTTPLPSGGTRPAEVMVIFMSALALAALLLGASASACRKAFARQRAWVASLPFPLRGYERTLGESYLERVKTVTLAKPPAKASDVVDAAVGLDPRDIEASLDVVTLAIRHRAVAGRGGSTDSPRSPDTNQNHRFRIWVRGPLLELVMALHSRYGVTDVKIAGG